MWFVSESHLMLNFWQPDFPRIALPLDVPSRYFTGDTWLIGGDAEEEEGRGERGDCALFANWLFKSFWLTKTSRRSFLSWIFFSSSSIMNVNRSEGIIFTNVIEGESMGEAVFVTLLASSPNLRASCAGRYKSHFKFPESNSSSQSILTIFFSSFFREHL